MMESTLSNETADNIVDVSVFMKKLSKKYGHFKQIDETSLPKSHDGSEFIRFETAPYSSDENCFFAIYGVNKNFEKELIDLEKDEETAKVFVVALTTRGYSPVNLYKLLKNKA